MDNENKQDVIPRFAVTLGLLRRERMAIRRKAAPDSPSPGWYREPARIGKKSCFHEPF